MQTSLGKYPQVVNGFENWEQLTNTRKQRNIRNKENAVIKTPMSFGTTIFHNQLMMYEVILNWGLKRKSEMKFLLKRKVRVICEGISDGLEYFSSSAHGNGHVWETFSWRMK